MKRVAPDGQMDWDDFGMEVRRIDVEPGGRADWDAPAAGERFVYVVAGAGTAAAGGDEHPLTAESVLWLEEGEDCSLRASDAGLAVLAARAPRPPAPRPR